MTHTTKSERKLPHLPLHWHWELGAVAPNTRSVKGFENRKYIRAYVLCVKGVDQLVIESDTTEHHTLPLLVVAALLKEQEK